MKLASYNYPLKTLVNLVIGVAFGRAIWYAGLSPALGWSLAIIATGVLYVVLNYRPVFRHSPKGNSKKQEAQR